MAIADTDIFTVEADYHDGTSVQTLRVSDAGPVPLTTGVSDTPPSTQFMPGLGGFVMQSRNAFGNCQTSGSADVADGEVTLLNPNGFNAPFDQFRGRAFDGRIVTVRRGQRAGAYPASYRTLMRAPMHAPVWGHDEFMLRVRDARKLTSVPLTTTLYAGTNVAGVGLEGTPDDLKGKRKPVAMGRTFNVNPVLVNAQKQIYQFADNTATVDDVRDGGYSLGVSYPLTVRTTPAVPGGSCYFSIADDGTTFVAVGESGTPTSLVMTSPDGITWTARTCAGTGITRVIYVASLAMFIAVGEAGKIYTSTDSGVTWTAAITNPFGATRTINALAYSPTLGLIIAATFSNNEYATSTDGTHWTTHAIAGGTNWSYQGAIWGKDKFIMVGQNNSTNVGIILYSTDGLTWTLANASIGAASNVRGLGYSTQLDRYVAANINLQEIYTSLDGITWFTRPAGNTNAGIAIVSGNGLFIGLGSSSNVLYESETGGETWVAGTAGTSTDQMWAGVTRGAALIAVGLNGKAYTTVVPKTYPTLTDLQDDAQQPQQGSYGVYSGPEGSYFRLGSPADQTITCDPVQGAAAANRTGAQIMVQGFTRAGLVVGTNWSAADITALDAANSAEMGVWYGPDDTAMCADPIDAAARSLGAFWAGDSSGVIRTKRLTDPSLGSSIATFTENDLQQTLIPLDSGEPNEGIAPYQTKVLYGKNYTVQTSGLDGAVSGAERAQFALEWREAKATDATVLAAHPLSQPSVIETIYAFEADAQTEATRLQTLKGANREWFSVPLKLTDAALDLELGDIITIVNGRFGLGLGVKAVVLGIAPDFKDSPAATHTLTVWTLAADASFAMYFMADGSDVIIGSGAEAYAFTDSGGGDYTLTAAPFAPTTARLNMALKAGDITLS